MRALLSLLFAAVCVAGCTRTGRTDDAFRSTATFSADRSTFARQYGVRLDTMGTVVYSGAGIDPPNHTPTFGVEVHAHGEQTSAGAPSFELHVQVEGEALQIQPIVFDAAGRSVNVVAAGVVCPRTWDPCNRAVDVRIERVGADPSEARFDVEVRARSTYRYRKNDSYDESISIASVTIL